MITLTDSASAKVRLLIAAEGGEDLMLRVTARPKGCSGFNYDIFFDTEKEHDDVEREFLGVRVVSDAFSAEVLTGAVLDYGDGVQGEGFEIMNPNAGHGCTCGKNRH